MNYQGFPFSRSVGMTTNVLVTKRFVLFILVFGFSCVNIEGGTITSRVSSMCILDLSKSFRVKD